MHGYSVASSPHSLTLSCRLWNQSSDDVDSLRVPVRTPVESLREFLEPVITQMDPEEGIEEPYKVRVCPVPHARLGSRSMPCPCPVALTYVWTPKPYLAVGHGLLKASVGGAARS